jgi:hypothetical protein
MTTKHRRVSVFAMVWVISAILGWLAGYEFDRRGGDVAMWVLCTIVVAGWAAACPYLKDQS